MHFITELIDNPEPDDPVKEFPHVHRHFMRYSKGFFNGPAIKARITKSTISFSSSFEYEDLLLDIAIKTLEMLGIDDDFIVSGNIIASGDFTSYLQEIGLDWKSVKSKGQTTNFKCVLKPAEKRTINVTTLKKIVDKLTRISYVLFSFKAGSSGEVTMKTAKNPPRPKQSKKSSDSDEADDISARLKFCSLKVPNKPEILDYFISLAAKDFKEDLPSPIKSMIITNNYEITDLILPDRNKVKSSALIRKLTLRKGVMIRSCDVNSKEKFSNKIKFRI